MYKVTLLAVSLLAAAGSVDAADLDQLQELGQDEFRKVSEDLGSALSYKALTPAEPMGTTGFDIGMEVTATRLESPETFELAMSGDDNFDTLPIAKLHAHKGLPFGIDVGASYATVPSTNIKLLGAEIRYALLEGGIATPAVAVRATYSTLQGVDQLDLNTRGLELTVSKGLTMATPYAGIGQVWVTSTPENVTGAESVRLEEEDFSQSKAFVGMNFNLGLMNFLVEADKTGDATTYGAKLGFRF
ncbi:hypothetical protein [Thiohalomonas denitrificans]|uniref:Outer membrane protein beta-barrel domain-containing protein n=1 Tax=Thiohalomonas denitrificans TaxID=415747 RepID=A0A1G5QV36_9GAMM|nr:hypothetical protein [Thiohalomonas denitrificans]SCZ65607.1 hypothetical protein SAMN03097708_02849 [Thiohalomonas denitrificans]